MSLYVREFGMERVERVGRDPVGAVFPSKKNLYVRGEGAIVPDFQIGVGVPVSENYHLPIGERADLLTWKLIREIDGTSS
jgi:hypothetical protein